VSAERPAVVPTPPFKPKDYECCGRGCSPCILDYYQDALERWEERVTAMGLDAKALLAKVEAERAQPLTPKL
jgi:hypothetical protein